MFTAFARFAKLAELASTSRILQFWQISCATCTSSEISTSHPYGTADWGSLLPPFWFMDWKHADRIALVQRGNTGRPNAASKWVRSAKAVREL